MRALLLALVLLAGCAAPERIALEAIRSNLATMSADWTAYVDADATLDEEARGLRHGLWADTVRLAEEGLR